MAVEMTADKFLAVLRRSRLIAEDRLKALLKALHDRGLPVDDARAIAKGLVRRGELTRWQAEKLLEGKYNGFWLGDYRVLGLLGEGGMGSVFLAEHSLLKRQCAVKVLPAKRVKDATYLPRFIREAQAAAALDHPNIVRAYDVDHTVVNEQQIHYLAMEYVKGRNVDAVIKDGGPLDLQTATEIARQAANGLAHAHEAALVHRDIKPSNLLLNEHGIVKILDLGLAKSFDEDEEASLTVAHNQGLLGTADYLSPEQAVDSHAVDHRSDIYSLGCTLYCMLTGHPPFTKGTVAQRIAAHRLDSPPPIRRDRPEVPADLVEIVDKMMAKDPTDRFQTAQEVAQQLDAWLRRHKAPAAGIPAHGSPTTDPVAEPSPDAKTTQSRHRPAEPAVGIDLGTTYSVVAYLDGDGKPATVVSQEGDPTTPSVVFFDRAGPVVGKEAARVAEFEPDRVARCAKRDMGESSYHKPIRGERFPPEVIQAIVLRQLKHDAQLHLGEFRKAVITVPAYFNEPRRKATQDAGQLAGLEVLDIINEPTAAAIAYGVGRGFMTGEGTAQQHETVLVYDLGGGTFDVTLMHIRGGHYRALATAGDVYLGGIDWDQRIAENVADRFLQEHGINLREHHGDWERLMQDAADAKRSLTARQDVTIRAEHGGKRFRTRLTRDEFQSLTADLLERTRTTVKKLLKEARLDWKHVTRLLLAGGATRMPMVRTMLEAESGLKVDHSLSPDQAVAHGAALYAGVLLRQGGRRLRGVSVQNVSSHDLGVLAIERATGRQRRRLMIPRNTPLPASTVGQFRTARDGQTSVVVPVVEGGTDSGTNATHIGQCIVKDLPENLPARTPVSVKFQYGQNGRLTVQASLPTAKCEATLVIERSTGLSSSGLKRWKTAIEKGLGVEDDAVDDEAHGAVPDASAVVDESPAVLELDESDSASSEDTLAVEDIDTGPPGPEPPPPDDSALGRFLDGFR